MARQRGFLAKLWDLLLVLIGIARFVIEVLWFLPRYLLLERHDHRSRIWGLRAEAMVCFLSPGSLDILSRMDCLFCPAHRPRSLSAQLRSSDSIQTLTQPDGDNLLNSFSLSNVSHASLAEQSTDDASTAAAAVLHTFAQWLRVAAVFGRDRRLGAAEEAMAAAAVGAASSGSDSHFLRGVFTTGSLFTPYSLLENASLLGGGPEARRRRRYKQRMANYYQERRRLSGRNGDKLSCWFPGEANDGEYIHVPYCLHSHKGREKKGFVPPWYAVHAKAQLILSLVDPLWRIVKEMFRISQGGEKTRNAPTATTSSHSSSRDSHQRDPQGPHGRNNNDTFLRMSSPTGRVPSYTLTEFQSSHKEIPNPLEEICYISPEAVKAFWACAQTRMGKTTCDKVSAPCNYLPSLAPMKSSIKNRSTKNADSNVSANEETKDSTASQIHKSCKVNLENAETSSKEEMTQKDDRVQNPPPQRGSTWHSRLTSIYWLHGLTPSSGSDPNTPLIILLLCPSLTQGDEYGYIARRMGALCEALTTMSRLRRQSFYNNNNNNNNNNSTGNGGKRHGLHPAYMINDPLEASSTTTTTADTIDPSFAAWHAVIPVTEVVHWPSRKSSKKNISFSSSSSFHRERVTVTVEDIDRIISHLCTLRTVSVHSSSSPSHYAGESGTPVELSRGTDAGESSNAATQPPPQPHPLNSHSHDDAKVVSRKVYIIGVGWSNASSPLLQYVMSYGTQSRMDGIICINHTASSNSALPPQTKSSVSKRRHLSGRDKYWSAQKSKPPCPSMFVSAVTGAVRLVLLAARLHLVANRLSLLRQEREQQREKQKQLVEGSEGSGEEDPFSNEQDARLVKYLRSAAHVVVAGEAVGGDNEAGHDNDVTLLSNLLHSPQPFGTPAEAPFDMLAQVEAHVDQEMSEWWLNEVQAGIDENSAAAAAAAADGSDGDDDADVSMSSSSNSSSTRGGGGLSPIHSSGRWRPLMSLSDWDALLQSREDISTSTLTGSSGPPVGGRYLPPPALPPALLPPPQHGASKSEMRRCDVRDSSFIVNSNDEVDRGEGEEEEKKVDAGLVDLLHDAIPLPVPTPTTRAASLGEAEDHDANGERTVISPPNAPVRHVSSLFEMARGGSDALSPTPMYFNQGQSRGNKTWGNAAKKTKSGMRTRPAPSPDIAMAALRYHYSSSAHFLSLIHVPALFVLARDDEMAPLNTIPTRALASNPDVLFILTRRGGYSMYLEGISTLYKLPQLTLQEREKEKDNSHSNVTGNDEVRKTPKPRQWFAQWMPRKERATEASSMKVQGSSPGSSTTTTSDHHNKNGMMGDTETVFVIENTTWMERLIIEFVASAVLTRSQRTHNL